LLFSARSALPFATPPKTVAVLKLSALGDVCHALPVIRTLQRAWPETRFTWIIGRLEARLLGGISDIEFLVYDKKAGRAADETLRDSLSGRPFDVLLHMQFAWRASRIARWIEAPVKLGFDRARALDLQWLFTTHRIEAVAEQHVMDGLFEFARRLGVTTRDDRWDIPIPRDATAYAERVIPPGQRTLVISPCSSHPLRNWNAAGYAAVADFATRALGLRVLLCGGPTEVEQRMASDIVARMETQCENLVGQDTLPQFYATLSRASVLITPDSGPAHMATSLRVPVVGLYAATNPARSGPYFSRHLCVDKFDAAAKRFHGRPASALPWRAKIEKAGVMDLITPKDVIEKLQEALAKDRL